MRRRFDKGWLIVLAIFLLIGVVWYITFNDGQRILSGKRQGEEVPYHSNENR